MRGCMIELSSYLAEQLKCGFIHFGRPISITRELQLVERDATQLRIEADWLPDWCEFQEGERLPVAALAIEDGICTIAERI